MGIQLKLFAVQQALKAPKDQFNSFGKYNYRSCESVLEALKPLLAINQMTLTLSDSVREIGGRIYIEATATANDIETGESYSVTAFAREEETKKGMDASQVTGASSSYARKYALNGLFAIDDNKDSDATNLSPAVKQEKESKSEQVERCAECGARILEEKRIDGTVMTIPEYVENSVKYYGKVLCRTCMRKHGKTS